MVSKEVGTWSECYKNTVWEGAGRVPPLRAVAAAAAPHAPSCSRSPALARVSTAKQLRRAHWHLQRVLLDPSAARSRDGRRH